MQWHMSGKGCLVMHASSAEGRDSHGDRHCSSGVYLCMPAQLQVETHMGTATGAAVAHGAAAWGRVPRSAGRGTSVRRLARLRSPRHLRRGTGLPLGPAVPCMLRWVRLHGSPTVCHRQPFEVGYRRARSRDLWRVLETGLGDPTTPEGKSACSGKYA